MSYLIYIPNFHTILLIKIAAFGRKREKSFRPDFIWHSRDFSHSFIIADKHKRQKDEERVNMVVLEEERK